MKVAAMSALSLIMMLSGCSESIQPSVSDEGLKDAYKNHFMIGGALNKPQALGYEPGALAVVNKHFNTITAENEMKWESLQPEEGRFTFDVADQMIALAQANDIFVVGHTMLWHQQTPDWVFTDEAGELAPRELVLQRLETHMTTIGKHFGERVQGWDVANEVFNDDGTWRDSKWYQTLGNDYVAETFKLADKVAPHAELYYNDYNLFKPAKRQAVVNMVKDLQSRGIRIDGVGIQGHYGLGYPDLNELEASVKAFAALGVKVMFTELDISVLPFPEEQEQGADVSIDLALQEKLNPYVDGMPEAELKQLNDYYVELFAMFLRHRDAISRVTFWGVNDGQSWRNYWPMQGRTDYPLLFDRDNQPKAAVQQLIDMAKRQ
ncbi:beta-xylanase [Neiella marina]|uniref:Beta-xylanase n=1 Tax=Neiella marina TaxID=508461 RepID=A0A8J2XNA8_9GAMM|nr:endo-1,4-beta-xylanase [Neiella marina]GGA70486.1 beta-xylanase [Neiella marina]